MSIYNFLIFFFGKNFVVVCHVPDVTRG